MGTPCVLFMGYRNKQGYGQKGRGGKVYYAHRLAYQDHYGIDPAGLCVCHKCDNPGCVNPAHLFLGTNAENMADKAAKGRQAHNRGEAAGGAKLTEAHVLEIRAALAAGATQRPLAEKYGVSQRQIGFIKTGLRWAHLGDKNEN